MKTLSFVIAVSLGASAPAIAAQPEYRSAFDGYRKFDDAQAGDWREANREVERIGGWASYTREAQAELKAEAARPAAAPAVTPPLRDGTKQPAPGAAPTDPHAGHHTEPAGKK